MSKLLLPLTSLPLPQPDMSFMGIPILELIVNVLAACALVYAVIRAIGGALAWSGGRTTGNYGAVDQGKESLLQAGVIVAIVALIVPFINWLLGTLGL
jgi:hypothetical protein